MRTVRVVILFVLAAALFAGCTTPERVVTRECITDADGVRWCTETSEFSVAQPASPATEDEGDFVDLNLDVDPAEEEAEGAAELAAVPTVPNCDAQALKAIFVEYVGRPYSLIALMDAQPTIDFGIGFTFEGADCKLVQASAVTGGDLPDGMVPLIVDGRTGVYLVAQPLTVNFVGSYVNLSEFDPNAQIVESAGLATSCMPVQNWIDAYNQYKDDTSAFVRWADSQTNVDGAPFLTARMRPNPLGPAEYTGYKPVTLVFWTRDGALAGVEGTDYVVLSRGDGMAVYLVATDQADLTHAHTGAQLCSDLNPTRDLGW